MVCKGTYTTRRLLACAPTPVLAEFTVRGSGGHVRVVSPEQFHTAKAQALDCQRERRRYEQQRFAVQRSAARMPAGAARFVAGAQ